MRTSPLWKGKTSFPQRMEVLPYTLVNLLWSIFHCLLPIGHDFISGMYEYRTREQPFQMLISLGI
ncbi:MAG: hypothetical protein DRP94_02500 [Candidatus Latescibacterota bacterium]|nr:MAG: hypothetical protein DRP94_02500 [Candidatus Latescibacterota bacterium]